MDNLEDCGFLDMPFTSLMVTRRVVHLSLVLVRRVYFLWFLASVTRFTVIFRCFDFFCLFILYLVCLSVWVCVPLCSVGVRGQLEELVLASHCVDSGDGTQVLGFGHRSLYPLCCLASLHC